MLRRSLWIGTCSAIRMPDLRQIEDGEGEASMRARFVVGSITSETPEDSVPVVQLVRGTETEKDSPVVSSFIFCSHHGIQS
jgi:hypothetical protein